MVLYHTITTYHLLEALVHKMKENKTEQSVLLISTWLIQKYPWYKTLENFFDLVIPFEANQQFSLENPKHVLNPYYYNILKNNNIDLHQCNEIHVLGAEHSFGIFLSVNKYDFIFWEEGSGAISKPEKMIEHFVNIHGEEKTKFIYQQGLIDGKAKNIKCRICNKNTQEKLQGLEDAVHFDLVEELEFLDDISRDNIVKLFYGGEKVVVKKKMVLWLTEHFANLNITTWDEQIYIYTILTDYFFENVNLCFKLHPDDFMYYEKFFQDSYIIKEKFPAELLPYIFSTMPECVATVSSSSIYGIREHFKNFLEFDLDFSHKKEFFMLHRYYVALQYINLYFYKNIDLYMIGTNKLIVDNFIKFKHENLLFNQITDFHEILELGRKTLILLDEVDMDNFAQDEFCEILKGLNENIVIVLLNSKNDYAFYNIKYKSIWNNIQPIEIKKFATNYNVENEIYKDFESEMIYIYSNGSIPRMEKIEKELKYTGMKIETEVFSDEQKQIKILEGILAATERRLLYYMEREKELLQIINGGEKN